MTAAMQQIDTLSKIRILRRMIETIMWEWTAVKEGRWEELPAHGEKKKQVLEEMSAYDWTRSAADWDNTELLIIESQIIDLEYQVKKMLEHRMNLLSSQLDDLKGRHTSWKKVVGSYRDMSFVSAN